MPALSLESKRALKLFLDRKVVSGWELASVVGSPEKLKSALQPLVESGWVDFNGKLEISEEQILLKSYFNLRQSKVSEAKSAMSAM